MRTKCLRDAAAFPKGTVAANGTSVKMRQNATVASNSLAKIAKDPDILEPGKLLHDAQKPT
jgi:hypothetical protein